MLRCLPFVVLGTALAAQSVVVPNANAATRGTSQLNSLIRNSANPRTYMYGIPAAELAGIPAGSMLTGVSFRFMVFASNSPSWPPADITWNDYQIFAGPAVAPASFTGNFLGNFSSPPVQVRSGPMRLPAGTYVNTTPPAPAPNAWGEFYFDFQTTYLYTGGDLGLLFSHPGSNDTATAQYLETVASSPSTHGVAFTQSVFPPGVAGASSTFCVIRVHHGYGRGCAGSGGRTPMLVANQGTSGAQGGPILLATANAPANAPCAYVVGAIRASLPLPNGCTLLLPPMVTVPLTLDAFGGNVLRLTVPPNVLGVIDVQTAVIDAGAPGNFTLTNGVEPVAR